MSSLFHIFVILSRSCHPERSEGSIRENILKVKYKKLKSIILAAGTAAALASCAQVSDVTEITGTVVPEGVDQVQVTVGEQIDTLVPVVDGKFTLTLPTDVCQLGTVAAGQYGLNFIPSGTAVQNARATVFKDKMTRDGYHLHMPYGRYTVACTWYEKILRRSVVGNTYIPDGMTAEQVLAAQKAAHAAVRRPDSVTNK